MSVNEKRIYSLDTFKAVAAFLVLIIHFNPFIGVSDYGVLVTDTIARTAVPFFFIVAGFLFAHSNKKINIDKLIIKRVKMLFIIHLIWGTIYYLIYIKDIYRFNIILYLKGLILTGLAIHLWFFPALIFGLIILYFFIKIKKVKYAIYSGMVLYILGLFGKEQVLSYYINNKISFNTRNFIFESLFFISVGYYIYNSDRIKEKIKKISGKLYMIMSIILIPLMVIERYYESKPYKEIIYGDYNITILLMSLIIFFIAIKYNKLGKDSIINRIGKYSLGVYLIHLYFVLKILNYEKIENKYIQFGRNLIFIVAIYVISLIIYILLNKIYILIDLKYKKLRNNI